MSESKSQFNDLRWTEPPQAKVIGHDEITAEERQQNKNRLMNHLQQKGIMKPDQTS